MSHLSCTFDDILRKIRDESSSTKDLGDKFERIIKGVLEEDKLYKDRFDRVWMWKDWAAQNRVYEKLGTAQDLGIDIVARERVGGELCAIQCKCNSDKTILDAGPASNFIANAAANGMKNYILACTGPINKNAMAKLKGVKCQIITKDDLRYRLDWHSYPKKIVPLPPKKLKEYQRQAVNDVIFGFDKNQRGKLIMACGTGKTLVSLHIAEKMVGRGGSILYLVPSISLILQSMREWADNANIPHYYMAVCSDKSVRNTEQGTLTELEAPASTDHAILKERADRMRSDALNVIFSTYHSVEVVVKAMKGRQLDMILCDEAHRTAGVDEQGSESYYTRVHYDKNVRAARRLYMTATPRIYTDAVKGKAKRQDRVVISMDDDLYGPEFHNLSFYDAVHKYKVLCDFKVRVAVMDANTIDKLVQKAQAGDEAIVPLDEKTLMASVWHALEHPGADGTKGLLQRVIMFCDMINSSKIVAGEEITYKKDIRENHEQFEKAKEIDKQRSFKKIITHVKKITGSKSQNKVDVEHVDGGDSAQYRRTKLEWLKTSGDDLKTCRILSNARCLSEGVDVPALDGVVFMNPRKSVVDVVQAVGRVMRKSPGKKFGYVILPVAIPVGVDVGDALSESKYFKVVWQVLNALRSHDPKLASEINKLVLTETHTKSEVTNRIIIRHAYSHGLKSADISESKMINGITSKLVQKVGDVNYYDKYGEKLGGAAITIETRIRNRMKACPEMRAEIEVLHRGLRDTVSESVTFDIAVQVLAQHMVLARVFDRLFSGEFTTHNPIAQVFESVARKIGLEEELHGLEGFYEDIDRELEGITTRDARQSFIKKIYGNFLASADKKGVKRHGIIYTPIEVVDFIIRSVDEMLQEHFGIGLDARSVKIFEPFAGTGTFLTRLLESGLITDHIYEKYRNDIFANEMILLAYYIATINIETTYSSLRRGGKYVPFDGISYTDTLRVNPRYREDKTHRQEQTRIDDPFKVAREQIKKQRGSHIHVIIGNPPWSAKQKKANDENRNEVYPELDRRVKNTYVQSSKDINPRLGNVTSLYDSYIRSLRWASDRIGHSGIVGFVTNAGFLRSEGGSGIRACLAKEFNEVWCFDLRGDQRTKGEVSKREGGKIFGSGSRAPVAVTILVKNPAKSGCVIRYKDIGEYLSPEKKLEKVAFFKSLTGIHDWKTIKPDEHQDWLDQRGQMGKKFVLYDVMGEKSTKAGKREQAIFRLYSSGLKTHRDPWVYNSSKNQLIHNMQLHIDYANSQKDPLNPIINPKKGVFTDGLKRKLNISKPKFNIKNIRIGSYRPFFKQHLYFDPTGMYTEAVYQTPAFFPKPDSKNLVICVPHKFKGDFSVFVVDVIPDLQIVHNSQCFPIYSYANGIKVDNITDALFLKYKKHYEKLVDAKNSNRTLTKESIFYYVYGLLHHKGYRKKYVSSLRREMPHIPMAPKFWCFSDAGRLLVDLHCHYDTGKQYDLGMPKCVPDHFTKISFKTTTLNRKKSVDKSLICDNDVIIFDNVPDINYSVNGRTPLEWLIDRYNRKEDKDSCIVNDPLKELTGKEIINLIRRLIYVGVESDRIINSLPDDFEPEVGPTVHNGLTKFTKID